MSSISSRMALYQWQVQAGSDGVFKQVVEETISEFEAVGVVAGS